MFDCVCNIVGGCFLFVCLFVIVVCLLLLGFFLFSFSGLFIFILL